MEYRNTNDLIANPNILTLTGSRQYCDIVGTVYEVVKYIQALYDRASV